VIGALPDGGDGDRGRRDDGDVGGQHRGIEARVGVFSGAVDRRREDGEAERRERHSDPLAPGDAVGEETIGGDGEEDETACDHRLHE
jgi:hypothetical protein